MINSPHVGAFRDTVVRMDENWVNQDPAESPPGMKPCDLVLELWFESPRDVATLAADPDIAAILSGAGHADPADTRLYLGEEQPAAAQ